ncbi:MAG: SDR family oxidoreductase [Pleurocapsa minor GSE-CHR-MK-17-07R]|jgi:glucose 1-dehydrogenase|nr:SDR family oxidoreductase [Pleurocapsa minor GSE-CHR-MK 17-07R]
MKLVGKTALVTGAASERSIGWGIARELALEGADVAVNDIAPSEALDARAEELAAMGRRSLAVSADVTRPERVEAMFAEVVQALGHIDIVVSNAGIIRWQHFLDITPEELRAVVNVNIMGTVNVCRAAATHMIRQGNGGRIIINSSVQSDVQFPITPVYGATKKAMHTLVGALALELAPHRINVTHIAPGWVRSPLNDISPELQTPEGVEAQRRVIPLRRDGHIDEMGRAVVYLASSDGDYVTGSSIRLDGGLAISKYSL